MTKQCAVCGEEGEEINWHYGVITCVACKKFFYRSQTESRVQYTCSGNEQKKCKITIENRASCKLCRFLKCLSLGMNLTLKSQNLPSNELIQSTACAVCSELSSGIHFGVATCEACKGFFRRSFSNKSMAQQKKYRCVNVTNTSAGMCVINKVTRQTCRYCRLEKCLSVGMSIESIQLGRQTNIFKHQVMENSKYSLPIKRKARIVSPSTSSPENSDKQIRRESKRARLTSTDTSFESSSSTSTLSSSSVKIPNILSSSSEMAYASPTSLSYTTKEPAHQQTHSNLQPPSNSFYPSPLEATSYYYSAYDHFLANTHLNQIYSRNLMENFNYGIINETPYQIKSSDNFLIGNQFNYKQTNQSIQSYPYVNSFYANQNYNI